MIPGVYVEEGNLGPPSIEGVPTGTAAMLGETARGPLKPRLVTSVCEFERRFGGETGNDRYLPDAVSGFFENGGKQLYVCRIVGKQATPSSAAFGDYTAVAVDPGAWGRRVWVRIDDRPATQGHADGMPRPSAVRLRIAYWSVLPEGGLFDPFEPVHSPQLHRFPPDLVEVFDDLVADPRSPNFIDKRLLDDDGAPISALAILVRNAGAAANALPATGSSALDGGDDGPMGVDDSDFQGEPGGLRTQLQGLAALEADEYRDVALVYAPAASVALARRVIRHCEKLHHRFAVLDSDAGASSSASLDPRATIDDTPCAAFYHPWIYVPGRQPGARRLVPPGGQVLGLYARTDLERGVFEAPANGPLQGVLGMAEDLTDLEQQALTPRGVNVIRDFGPRGIRVWGARTMSSDPLWKYVNIRRLLIFIERSIDEGTQWVVFEPNDARSWARVKAAIRDFLVHLWRDGALAGRTEHEACFVTCDETTMTQDDIVQGRLICEVGIAPVRPAEFVVFRVCRFTADAQR